MKDLKNIIYAIIFSTIGGVVSITGYNYMYPRNNTVAEINNDVIFLEKGMNTEKGKLLKEGDQGLE